MSLYRELDHKFMPKGSKAYDIGDPSDMFYVLVDGEVSL